MQTYDVTLQCPASQSFRCQKAANSVDLDLAKKLQHNLRISIDLETPFNVGLIVGASGSGKTTLAEKIFGNLPFLQLLDLQAPIIEQFPASYTYEDCVRALNGSGLSQVPCWIRPAYTLSNGQRARAEIALQLASDRDPIVIDEFTSVVDRTVAKAMSHTVQKVARAANRRVILLSCHYDVIEWLNPCFIVDCNKAEYTDRRAFFLTSNAKNSCASILRPATGQAGAILANIII